MLGRIGPQQVEVAQTIIDDDEGYTPDFLSDCLHELTGERLTAEQLSDHRDADCTCNPD